VQEDPELHGVVALTPLTLVFDLDGTLAETAPDLIDALNYVLAGDGIAPVPVDAARALVGAGARALIERGYALGGRALTRARLDESFDDFLKFYNAHFADKSTLFPGVEACLDRCRAEGWTLAVCTNKLEYSSNLLLGKLGVRDRFAFVCGQDTFGVAKPDPKPLVETVRRAGGDVSSSLMIGDSVTDIRTARAAGIPVIAVDFGYTDTPVADLGPDRVISHFDDLFDAVRDLVERG
jgi:phosphoglycolate phosphatase